MAIEILALVGVSLLVSFYILYLQYSKDVLKSENERLKEELWSFIAEFKERKK
jgi:hypothetical protein